MTARIDFRVGDWLVRPELGQIERAGKRVHLKPKAMAVLVELVQADGRLVSRNALLEAVWPGLAVTDDVLTQCVVELRKAFGDEAKRPDYIETIPRRGLRLVAPVREPGEERQETPATRRGFPTWVGLIAGFAAVLVLTVILYFVINRSGQRQPVIPVDDVVSLAVLPFADMSPARDQEYFADGLSEELLNRLAQLASLQVAGRTSSFYFKGKSADLRVIGETLNVGYILEGSVRKSEDQIRITVQLVDVLSGFQLWARKYDRQLQEIFAVQDEIAAAVATALSVKLAVGELAGVEGGTTNLDAYNEYLRGQSLYQQFTRESVASAIQHFKRATEIDPEYALAWERVADTYIGTTLLGIAPEDWQQKSEDALVQAIRLAPTAPAIVSTAAWKHMNLRQWEDVERLLSPGTGLDPGADINGIINYSLTLGLVGKTEEAIEYLERARHRDPLSALVAYSLAHVYAQAGRMDEAYTEIERGLGFGAYESLLTAEAVVVGFASGNPDLVVKWVTSSIEQEPTSRPVNGAMLELFGDRDASLRRLHELYDADESGFLHDAIAIWATYYGDHDLALGALSKVSLPWLFWMPSTAEIRQLPEFKDLVQDFGLLDYWQEYGWGEYCRPVGIDSFECNE